MNEQEGKQTFDLIVNKTEHKWPTRYIGKEEILRLAGSPADYLVNQLVPGPGEDPQINAEQRIDLDHQAEPKGIKRFQTRKPATDPGA